MLDIKFIRENKEAVKKNASNRGMDFDVEKLLEIDERRRALLAETESLRAEQNKANEMIIKEKDGVERQNKINEMKGVKDKLVKLEQELKIVEEKFNGLMLAVPNMMQPDTPIGRSEADNVVLREVGNRPKFAAKPRDYMEIAEANDLIDIERAAKVSGSRFGYLKNELALLEFGLFKFALDIVVEKGFKFVIPPVMVKSAAMRAMG
jgi:seryl-tRNA synthetase